MRVSVKESSQMPQRLFQHVHLGKKMIFCSGNIQNVWCHQEFPMKYV